LDFFLLQRKERLGVKRFVKMIHPKIPVYVSSLPLEYLVAPPFRGLAPKIATAFIIHKNDFCPNKLNSKK
jgi:hypothetical protein